MKKKLMFCTICAVIMACNTDKSKENLKSKIETKKETNLQLKYLKPLKKELPTIGLLMYNGVLQGEVVATSDVFAKHNKNGEQLFNVITIAETETAIITEEGMKFVPDYTFNNCPKLTALFVPSAYEMEAQINNKNIINFIKNKNPEAKYIVSNCAGAQLIGKSGIASGHKIVTWIGGGKQLQIDYPDLKVENDSLVAFVEDGKFSSSNGNLASYISALNLLEKMTNLEHRNFVESYLYLDRLQKWKQ